MNMDEYNKTMLEHIEQTYLEPDASCNNEVYCHCAVCGCEGLINEMHRDDVHNAYVCDDCIINYCDVDNALRFLAANAIERDYFVRVYMCTDCADSADSRIIDACKDAWFKKYSTRKLGDYSYEFETLRDYVLMNDYWSDWVASELLS